jgi:ferredoxin-NADP reductase
MFNKVSASDLAGIPDGEMSTYMHTKEVGDIVKLGPVFGPSILAQGGDDHVSRPVACFISVGIGITPTWAMLPTAMATKRTVCVFHADESAKNVPFHKELIELMFPENDRDKKSDHILSFSYSRPVDNDDDKAYYSEAYLTADKICTMMQASKQELDYKEGTDYYVCAGASTAAIVKGLWKQGINKDHVHTEFFGPFASVTDDE